MPTLPDSRTRAAPPPAPPEDLSRMGLLDHLEELRRRILYSLITLVVAFLACWTFVQQIYAFLERPIHPHLPPGTKLSYLGPADPLILYIKVAMLAALFLSAPVLLYQAWRFISPGLYARERRWAAPFIVLGTSFFVAGGAFAYYVAFPFAVEFLLGVGEQFQAVITIERYFRFLMTVILGLGLMFELPIVIFVLSAAGLVTPAFLIRHFRWAVLLIFVAAAIITPTPDIVNLCVFAVPTIGLYLLGVGAAWVVHRGKGKGERRQRGE
ncbi:MAG TPA: twin-arginine translocase subunit TatC [Thermoanaerobaculia bacterium]|nr:twin-arginine translocase subunit TatC [Thermoanaerobaculia bacterium]